MPPRLRSVLPWPHTGLGSRCRGNGGCGPGAHVRHQPRAPPCCLRTCVSTRTHAGIAFLYRPRPRSCPVTWLLHFPCAAGPCSSSVIGTRDSLLQGCLDLISGASLLLAHSSSGAHLGVPGKKATNRVAPTARPSASRWPLPGRHQQELRGGRKGGAACPAPGRALSQRATGLPVTGPQHGAPSCRPAAPEGCWCWVPLSSG